MACHGQILRIPTTAQAEEQEAGGTSSPLKVQGDMNIHMSNHLNSAPLMDIESVKSNSLVWPNPSYVDILS